MRHRIATLLALVMATGCATTRSAVQVVSATPVPSRASGLLFEHFSTFAAGDGLADAIVVVAVRGGEPTDAHGVSVRFPSGALRETWPDAEVADGSLRWSFHIAPPGRCADEAEWPYERSLGCGTIDGTCVGAALHRWRTTEGCVESSEAVLPIALARVNGVPTRAGLPRLVRRGFEWGIDAPEGYEDGRPLVLVDVLGAEGEARETRLRVVRDAESFHLDQADAISLDQARAAFAEYFASNGLSAADAALAASFALPAGRDPLEGLGDTDALHAASVALFVPLLSAELEETDSPPPDDASLSLARAGVVRWVDGTWPSWPSLEDRREGFSCRADDPEAAYHVESSFSRVVSHCKYEAGRRGAHPNGRVIVTLSRSPTDERVCGERWDEHGEENPSYDADVCAGVSLEIEETTLVDDGLLACLHRLGEAYWGEMPETPVRCFATVASP